MGEISYIVADTASPQQQTALSSIIRAMYQKGVLAIARMVSRDDADPKMGILKPCIEPNMDYLLWAQMPFADDVRRYRFAPLDMLVSKKGESITEHPYLPTKAQQTAMDEFVDSLDLMEAGDKDEEGYVYALFFSPHLFFFSFLSHRIFITTQQPDTMVRHPPVIQPSRTPYQTSSLSRRSRIRSGDEPDPATAP
jgi:hypothetical protein